VSRGLGLIERAVAACIAGCKRSNDHADLYIQMGAEPPPPVVHVTAWGVCVQLSGNTWDSKRPTEAQLKAAKRAMHSFVRKHPQYGVAVGRGRGTTCLYEQGDRMSAMLAKLNSQTSRRVSHADAMAALAHVEAGRDEPFTLKAKRFIHYRGLSHGLTQKEPRTFRDLDLS
jgi:hypothetical protein